MFHFPGLCSPKLSFPAQSVEPSPGRFPIFLSGRFPDSEILGSKGVCPSPRLIAAYHVLLPLLAPRHPPCTHSSLTILFDPPFSSRTRYVTLTNLSSYLSKNRKSFVSLMEPSGIEPLTSCLQSRRSPS